jgi:hypothetical protein
MFEVDPCGALGNPEYLGHLWHTADFDDGEQDAKLRWVKLNCLTIASGGETHTTTSPIAISITLGDDGAEGCVDGAAAHVATTGANAGTRLADVSLAGR